MKAPHNKFRHNLLVLLQFTGITLFGIFLLVVGTIVPNLLYSLITEPLPPAPSPEVRAILESQPIFFMGGQPRSIFVANGYQREATIIKQGQEYRTPEGTYRVDYFLPTPSPDNKYLAYYKIFSFARFGGWPGDTHLIELVVLNLSSNEELIPGSFSKEATELDLPLGMQRGEFDLRQLSKYSLGWINESTLIYNFINSSYIYRVDYVDRSIPGRPIYRPTVRAGNLVELDTSHIDTCFSSDFAFETPKICMTSRDGRFEFFHMGREGFNAVWYIKARDTKTGEEFLLTIIGRSAYAE